MKIQVLLFDDANSIVHRDVIVPKANITASIVVGIWQAAVDFIRETALTKPIVHRFLPCVKYLLFLRAVRIYGIMSFTDSRIILPLFSLSASSSSSSCSSGSSSSSSSESAKRSSAIETILAMPPGRRRPRCTFRGPALHELSSLSLLHSHVVYKQPVLRRLFTHRRQILTLHNRATPQAPLCNRELWKRNKRKRSIVKSNKLAL
jgi:hypothetical protein